MPGVTVDSGDDETPGKVPCATGNAAPKPLVYTPRKPLGDGEMPKGFVVFEGVNGARIVVRPGHITAAMDPDTDYPPLVGSAVLHATLGEIRLHTTLEETVRVLREGLEMVESEARGF